MATADQNQTFYVSFFRPDSSSVYEEGVLPTASPAKREPLKVNNVRSVSPVAPENPLFPKFKTCIELFGADDSGMTTTFNIFIQTAIGDAIRPHGSTEAPNPNASYHDIKFLRAVAAEAPHKIRIGNHIVIDRDTPIIDIKHARSWADCGRDVLAAIRKTVLPSAKPQPIHTTHYKA